MSDKIKTGYYRKGIRAKEGAYETIDNVIKFALSNDDYEEYEEWVEYTEEELNMIAANKEAMDNKAKKDLFLNEAPTRLNNAEKTVAKLETLSADNSVSIEDLMDAIAELGAIVAGK